MEAVSGASARPRKPHVVVLPLVPAEEPLEGIPGDIGRVRRALTSVMAAPGERARMWSTTSIGWYPKARLVFGLSSMMMSGRGSEKSTRSAPLSAASSAPSTSIFTSRTGSFTTSLMRAVRIVISRATARSGRFPIDGRSISFSSKS